MMMTPSRKPYPPWLLLQALARQAADTMEFWRMAELQMGGRAGVRLLMAELEDLEKGRRA